MHCPYVRLKKYYGEGCLLLLPLLKWSETWMKTCFS